MCQGGQGSLLIFLLGIGRKVPNTLLGRKDGGRAEQFLLVILSEFYFKFGVHFQ